MNLNDPGAPNFVKSGAITRSPNSSFNLTALACLLLAGSSGIGFAQDDNLNSLQLRQESWGWRNPPLPPQAVNDLLYWDADGVGSNMGGTGNWGSANTWRTGPNNDGTLGNWLQGGDATFLGTAGTVMIDTSLATGVTAGTVSLETTGYIIVSNAAARPLNATFVSLSAGVTATMTQNSAASPVWNWGSFAVGAGGNLILNGAGTTGGLRINLNGTNGSSAGDVTIGTNTAGTAGFVATATGVQLNSTITNNTSANTMLGANSGFNLTFNGKVTGSAALQFSSGSTGGAGTVIMNSSTSDYTGDTFMRMAATGTVRLGASNPLPTSTTLRWDNPSGLGGILDLNGKNLEISAFESNSGAAGSIRNSAPGTTSVLTVSGSTFNGFGGGNMTIADGSSGARVALVRNGTGTLALFSNNTYSGGTTINGGSVEAFGDHSLGRGNVDITVGGGIRLTLDSGNDFIFDDATLSLVTGAMVNLSFFGNPDIIDMLVYNGAALAPGLWGAPGSGAPNTLAEFMGPGRIFVVVPEPSTWAMTIIGTSLLLSVQHFRRKKS